MAGRGVGGEGSQSAQADFTCSDRSVYSESNYGGNSASEGTTSKGEHANEENQCVPNLLCLLARSHIRIIDCSSQSIFRRPAFPAVDALHDCLGTGCWHRNVPDNHSTKTHITVNWIGTFLTSSNIQY